MNEEDFKRNPRSALLFEAADLLERRAERCVPGPWKVDGRSVVPEDDEWDDVARDCPAHDEADWIAMMDPTIAPHLASLLQTQARNLYMDEAASGNTPVTREYVKSVYGDYLELTAKLLKRRDIPWAKDPKIPTT